MDEEEKPFPIEFIVILLLVAIANDVAEVFFDLLAFTGAGISGEAIMEPINFVFDFFFTGIFWWKVGPGGSTITQYFGDLLEPLFIPGRTISVALGIWIANHPSSIIGKVTSTATSLEGGNVGGVAGEAKGAVASATTADESTQRMMDGKDGNSARASATTADESTQRMMDGKDGNSARAGATDDEEKENTPEDDVFKNPYDNPVGTAAEELNAPPEEEFHEGKGFEKAGTEEEPQKVIDIASRRPPSPQKNKSTDDTAKDLAEAA